MIPTRHRRPLGRRLAGPILGLTVVLAVPMVAGADQGKGGGKDKDKDKQVESEGEATTTSIEAATTVTLAPESSTPATTVAPVTTTTSTSTSSTTASSGGESGSRREVGKQLGELIKKVEKSKLPTEVRDALLARLRAMRDAAANGTFPTAADLRALLRDVEAAFQRPSGDGTTSTIAAGTPTTTSMSGGSSTTSIAKRIDATKVVKQLDEWTAKVNASALSAADKATLLTAIDRLRTLATTTTVSPADLELVKTAVSTALDHDDDHDDHASTTVVGDTTTSAPGGSDDSAPRPKGRAAVDAAIQTVTNSPLPDALKQQILGVLTQAKTIIEDPSLTKEQVAEQLRELHRVEHQRRLDEAAAKLTRFSEKIATLAFQAGALPGAGDVIVVVHDLLADANDLLAAETPDIETVKAAWKLLHEARTTLQQFLDSATSTTTAGPTTTDAATTTVAAVETSAGG